MTFLYEVFGLIPENIKIKSLQQISEMSITATDGNYPDVELPLKLLLFHVLISRPYFILFYFILFYFTKFAKH